MKLMIVMQLTEDVHYIWNDQVYKSVNDKNSFLVEKENGKIKETVLSKINLK